jgi:hypothetical protein
MVINDFLRGKIPWYIPDPSWPERKPREKDEEFEGREGRLGEMRMTSGGQVVDGTDDEGWDGINVESDDDEEDTDTGDETDETSKVDDDEIESGEEEEEEEEEGRIEDPRPSKKQKKDS